ARSTRALAPSAAPGSSPAPTRSARAPTSGCIPPPAGRTPASTGDGSGPITAGDLDCGSEETGAIVPRTLRPEGVNGHAGSGEDLDERRARGLARGARTRPLARPPLRQRGVRGHPLLRHRRRPGGLPPGRPPGAARALGGDVLHADPVPP